MDALGAAGSAIAVVGAVADLAKETVRFLKRLKRAPLGLLALVQEVNQIRSVIDAARCACELDRCPAAIPLLLEEAKALLLHLKLTINTQLTKDSNPFEVDRLAWARHEREAKDLVESLRNIRSNITAVLSVAALYVTSPLEFVVFLPSPPRSHEKNKAYKSSAAYEGGSGRLRALLLGSALLRVFVPSSISLVTLTTCTFPYASVLCFCRATGS